MKKNLFALAVTLCSSLYSPLALADIASSSTVSELGYTLIDLDENDGITPSFSFYDVYWNNVSMEISNQANPVDDMSAAYPLDTLDPASFEISNKTGLAGTQYGGGMLGSASANGMVGVDGKFSANTSMVRVFNLSPMTELVFLGNYHTRVQSSALTSGLIGASTLTAALFGDDFSSLTWHESHLENSSGDVTLENSGAFEVRLSNTYDFSRDGQFLLSTSAYGQHYPVPVPEPESWAMLGIGLLCLGAAVRRRQAKR